MPYITVKQAAVKWGISERRVRLLCAQGAIDGAFQVGRGWNIPASASKPTDRRTVHGYASVAAEIETLKKRIEDLRPLTAGELRRLNEEFSVEYTYNSNAIEGNTLTLRETELVLRGLTIDKKPLKDHLEAVGHKEAFDYICELVKEKATLNAFVIKQIHTLVLADKPQDRGVYRRVPVRIMGAAHTPAEPYLIEEQLDALIATYNARERQSIADIAEFHLLFEGIHPFIDGNGRTGRLIANLELMKAGYLPVDIKFADRKRYYDAFDAYYLRGDAEPMSLLLAQYERERMQNFIGIIR